MGHDVTEGEHLTGKGSPPPWVGAAIRAGRRYAFMAKRPLTHNAINLGALIALLSVLLFTGWLTTAVSPWVGVPLGALLFGWVYFGLFVLVAHEASHNMFLVFDDRQLQRRVNRIAGWMVTPLFAVHYGKHWERGHAVHHVRPMEPDDPQRSVATGKRLLGLALGYLLVPGFLLVDRTLLRKREKSGKSASTTWVLVFFVCFWALALTAAAIGVGWPLAVALYLGIPVLAVFNLVKGSLEHGGAIAEEASPFLRSRTSLFPLRRLILPFNISLHFEHHLNFQVPWYELGNYQRDLRAIVPLAVQREVWEHPIAGQLSGRLGGLSAEARAAREPL